MKGIVAYQAAAGVSGSVAEWSKALVLGTSLPGGVGSNPTAAKFFLIFLCDRFFRLYSFERFFWYNAIGLYLSPLVGCQHKMCMHIVCSECEVISGKG